jgi:uncharacterized protein (DUF697 family)
MTKREKQLMAKKTKETGGRALEPEILHEKAERIIRDHVMVASGVGLIPVPVVDLFLVTSLQMEMVGELAALYGSPDAIGSGKLFVTALTGAAGAKIGASLIKSIPGLGSLIGGVSMSVMAGASTYAVGQVVRGRLDEGGRLDGIDPKSLRSAYEKALQRGRKYVSDLRSKGGGEFDETVKQLERLARLHQKGVLSDREYKEQKSKLLERL